MKKTETFLMEVWLGQFWPAQFNWPIKDLLEKSKGLVFLIGMCREALIKIIIIMYLNDFFFFKNKT